MTLKRWKFWPKNLWNWRIVAEKKTFAPWEKSLVLWIVLHRGLKIPLEENKQSCEAVRLQKVNTKNLRTNFASEYSPWCWLFSYSCLQCPGGRSPQNRPRVQESQRWCCHWVHPPPCPTTKLNIRITKAQMLTWTAPEDTMNISIPTSPFLQM